MAKSASQSQSAFSFLDEVAKTEPLPKAKKNTLKPPQQIVVEDEKSKSEESIDTGSLMPESLEEIDNDFIQKEVIAASDDIEIAEPTPNTEANAKEMQHEEGSDRVFTERKNTRGRKSTRENTLAVSRLEIPSDEDLFSKQYYSMGEVTTMFNENHSLIRYWESEFDILKPKKNGKGDRFFRPVDVKNLYLIYDLLRRRKFTIEGAREYLKNNKKADEKFAAIQSLEKIKSFFLELKATL